MQPAPTEAEHSKAKSANILKDGFACTLGIKSCLKRNTVNYKTTKTHLRNLLVFSLSMYILGVHTTGNIQVLDLLAEMTAACGEALLFRSSKDVFCLMCMKHLLQPTQQLILYLEAIDLLRINSSLCLLKCCHSLKNIVTGKGGEQALWKSGVPGVFPPADGRLARWGLKKRFSS